MAEADPGRREGGLEAPTRHPLDWQNDEFYDQERLDRELLRVFDICHGCRRCVSLCQAFPTLFDLVDETANLEMEEVARGDYRHVVDHCYLCDLCYQTKCPYVPPHEWAVDFPHLMLRAKAVAFKQKGASPARRLLTRPATMGRLGSAPVAVKLVNKIAGSRAGRALLDKSLGVHPEAAMPAFADPPLNRRQDQFAAPASAVEAAGPTRGRVAIFATCYGQYYQPHMVEDLLAVLRHNGIEAKVLETRACCGMPKLELGDLETVAEYKSKVLPVLAEAVTGGWDIVTPVPSCTLMFKQELPLMFPDDETLAQVRAHTFDPFEYLVHRRQAGLLNTDFATGLGRVSYQIPCHQRVQNIGKVTRDILALIPETELKVHERCSGHDGTYGIRRQTYAHAQKIARPVVRQINKYEPEHIASDCPLAADHLAHALADGTTGKHPISLLRLAYGV